MSTETFNVNLPEVVVEVETRGEYRIVKVNGYTFATLGNDTLIKELKLLNESGEPLDKLFAFFTLTEIASQGDE